MDEPWRDVTELWGVEAATLRPIGDGRNSRHWRAESAHGPIALRRYGADTSMSDAAHEHSVLTALAQVGVLAPRPLPASTGATVVERSGLWAAFEWIEGSMPALGDSRRAAEVGRVLARVHNRVAPPDGRHSFGPLADFADTPRWGGLSLRSAIPLLTQHDARRGNLLGVAVDRLDVFLDPLRGSLVEDLVLTHGDLHRENIRVTPDGAVILDWAFAHRDSRAADLGIIYRLWPNGFDDLMAGYVEVSSLSAEERWAIPILAAARGLDHLADRVTRWAAGSGPDPAAELDIELPDFGKRLSAFGDTIT